DFIDIDIERDTPLFIDPYFIGKKKDVWSTDVTLTIRSFFQRIIDLIIDEQEDEARELFNHLHETNDTCLGLSLGRPDGNGVGDGDANAIFDNLLESRAVETGLIQDIEDSILFVDNFGKDKLSDMTTNIIAGHLLSYTQEQCDLHGIPLTQGISSKYYWS